ncbi:MurR/RpiR family transcriptional regulator [Thermoflavimicrobium daqui]|uniref:MurR/RpiR family transcriptional regulator n=1 Tax=Thermoflavimicrobium daqui TaxID=2137476 RepID=A0A364K952_9BACL|nr:MurR/RpiR family transcriptional regulator [Thermoflavimicrobium daqui]RAL26825.1 MurR/RpiR family transcriptional regulator [Thermoflavimicrobium daqui]
MADIKNIFQLIREKSSRMSKSQLKIAKFLEENLDTVPFLTVANVAKQVGVGEATIIRFATNLGFSGFSEMQQSLQEHIRKRLTTVDRLNLTENIYSEKQRLATDVLLDDIKNIEQTIQTIDLRVFDAAVKQINRAKSITVVSLRSSYALGYFLTFYLDLMLKNVQLIPDSDTMFEKLSSLRSEDLVIGISFAQYTSRTIQAIEFVKKRGVNTLAITDHHSSPLARLGDLTLVASSKLPSFLDSFVAPLSLINALLMTVAETNKMNISQHLSDLEELWESEQIYYSPSK